MFFQPMHYSKQMGWCQDVSVILYKIKYELLYVMTFIVVIAHKQKGLFIESITMMQNNVAIAVWSTWQKAKKTLARKH